MRTLSPYLTLREAAAELGMGDGRIPSQRLRRMLLEREIGLGLRFMLRGRSRNSPWRVTEPLLREHCPELFDRRDELAQMLRRELDVMRDQIIELRERDKAIAQQLGARIKALRIRVDRLHGS